MKTKLTRVEKTGRIVLALLVGTLIWGAAIDDEAFSVEVELPLVLEAAEGYVVLGDRSDSVMVKLTGSGLEMLSHQISFPLSGINRSVQISGIQSFPASITLGLRTSDIHPQGSVVVSRLIPDHITFTIDTVISRELPVSVLSSDGIPFRFRFVSVEPDCITVTGPSSIVLLMDSVATEAVSISSGHVTASLAFSSEMVAYSEGLVQIRIYEPAVSAAIPD
ncbi:MAG: hypothetical protein KAR40_04315 [Candidatus Sabulitectum sp.]|nr:hypothetical protein [Candidatus Sabulitectum sp.]